MLVDNILNNLKIHFNLRNERFNDSISKMIVKYGYTNTQLDEDTFRKLSTISNSIAGDSSNIDLNHHFKISTGNSFYYVTIEAFKKKD